MGQGHQWPRPPTASTPGVPVTSAMERTPPSIRPSSWLSVRGGCTGLAGTGVHAGAICVPRDPQAGRGQPRHGLPGCSSRPSLGAFTQPPAPFEGGETEAKERAGVQTSTVWGGRGVAPQAPTGAAARWGQGSDAGGTGSDPALAWHPWGAGRWWGRILPCGAAGLRHQPPLTSRPGQSRGGNFSAAP